VVYLALPPAIFADTIEALVDAGLPEGSRLVVEKPFGTDSASAEQLNDLIHRRFDEQDVFRVDHFLGKQTAHNIIAARFANRILEPVWSTADISKVEVIWDETLALEGRAGYYDGTGAAEDMLQNHLLQLMCLVAMEPPDSLDHSCVADRKVEVLRAARPWSQDLASCSVRARYTAGRSDGDEVPAYVDEEGVDPDARRRRSRRSRSPSTPPVGATFRSRFAAARRWRPIATRSRSTSAGASTSRSRTTRRARRTCCGCASIRTNSRSRCGCRSVATPTR
jgi:glucose-6-phosphate 1-dehydrogenase